MGVLFDANQDSPNVRPLNGDAPNQIGDGQVGKPGDVQANNISEFAAVDGQKGRQAMTQIADRAQTQFPLIDKDGKVEQKGPILHVNNFDRNGQPAGTSEYKYNDDKATGVKLDGYVDRDAQGNVKEFAVRKPALGPGQKDVFMVFRFPPPGSPDEEKQREGQMKHVYDLLRPDLPQDQQLANQKQLDTERPLAANLMHNIGNQIMTIRLDPQSGQRYTIRDMRIDPMTGNKVSDNPNPMICWQAPDGIINRYPVAKLPDEAKTDLVNATGHGQMRTPLWYLKQGQRDAAPPTRI